MIVCPLCNKEITQQEEVGEEMHFVDGKQVHSDCYFQDFGEGIEQHPVVMPTRRVG